LVAVFLLAFATLESSSSTISILQSFIRRQDLIHGVNGGIGGLQLSRYGSSDLSSLEQCWIFSHRCRKEDYPRAICLGCYVFDNGDSYSRLSSDVDQAVQLIFLSILVLVLLPMLIDYFNDCTRACSLGIAAQVKQ
jgi:hypothetical protein